MLEVIKTDYIRTAWAKGLSPFKVYYKHALRNSLVGTLAVLGINFGMLLGGSVVTELVFQWPGLGTLFIQALMSHDYQLIQVLVLVYALLFTLVNLIVDLIYSILDPRITFEG
jgi:peptide/nickel transport system permease protein